MDFFWPTVVAPLLDALAPRTIIEVGCEKGATTRRLLDWCARHDAALLGVDPKPQFDVDAWTRESAGRFTFHRALSLDVMPALPRADTVLIDGDHNWFTVLEELRQLARTAGDQPFPLTLLHDIAWPYGRRDLYHAPDTIPPGWRQPHARGGMRHGIDALVSDGINAHQHHAVHEGGPRNGVLTAVEDFLAESPLPLDFISIPGLFGLGILADRRLLEAVPALAAALNSWRLSESARGHIERVEEARLAEMSARIASRSREVPANVLIVAATGLDADSFHQFAPLSLERFAWDARIQSVVVGNNTGDRAAGLGAIYNRFLTREFADRIVVFTHDDVHLDDWQLADRLHDAMQRFDIVGVAGNRAPNFAQPAWGLAWDAEGKSHWQPSLSGCVNHIIGDTTKQSHYGPTPAEVELLDGCFLAVNVARALTAGARFDERFHAHFYDLDFSRAARARGLRLGTWPIAITHASGGAYGSPEWKAERETYFAKWPA